MSRILAEFNSIGVFGVVLHISDGVIKPTGPAHNGHGTVPEAVHLIEAAWFEAGRHKEEIATRFDAVRQSLVVTDAHADTRRKSASKILESSLEGSLAR